MTAYNATKKRVSEPKCLGVVSCTYRGSFGVLRVTLAIVEKIQLKTAIAELHLGHMTLDTRKPNSQELSYYKLECRESRCFFNHLLVVHSSCLLRRR